MVLADKTLFAAGPPDIVDEEENFFILDNAEVLAKLAEQKELLRGKEGAVMWAVSALDGKKLSEYKLDSLPVWDGMIASGGNLYIITMDGEVICYSGKSKWIIHPPEPKIRSRLQSHQVLRHLRP